ncbi:SDR family NAD(P)-dependent oxidoreductase [Enterococcus pallens]|nr:SDR family NAD(P)-dependent oxidoreductase [Enterococcus pallens]
MIKIMKEFKGKTAVITGAGNGFGAEFSKEAAKRGMKLVLADIEPGSAERTLKECKQLGAEGIALEIDVSLQENVQKMVKAAMDNYGTIDLLINNAGISMSGRIWELPPREWEWTIDINLMSQVYAMHEVIPIMLEQKTPCHIVNVASVAGTIAYPTTGPYNASKHASVLASETAYIDLKAVGADIGISVYCPGFVQTTLHHSHNDERRPARYKINDHPYYKSETYKTSLEIVNECIETGSPIDSVGMLIFQAIEEEQFYILTHPIYNALAGGRIQDMLSGKNPDLTRYM